MNKYHKKILLAVAYLVFNNIRVTKVNICRYTGFSRPTVNKYIDDLSSFFLLTDISNLKKGGKF